MIPVELRKEKSENGGKCQTREVFVKIVDDDV